MRPDGHIPEDLVRLRTFNHTNRILGAGDPEYMPEDADVLTELLVRAGEPAALMAEVAEAKGGDGTDLTSLLVNAELEDDQLTPGDLASFFILLVVAATTTRNAISWGLKFLTDNLDQRAIWMADFDGVAPTGSKRLSAWRVRYRWQLYGPRRHPTRRIQRLRSVLLPHVLSAANRDEDVLREPV
ncbi:MAG: hypothetical protein R2706_15405 [Acidimicrobiales bacterium]